jgi:plastocyanin
VTALGRIVEGKRRIAQGSSIALFAPKKKEWPMRVPRLFLLAALVAACAACSSNNSSPMPTSPSSSSTVSIVSGAAILTTTAYSPNPVVVARGTTVMWMNNDNTTHTSTADNGGWSSGAIAPGGTFSTTMQTAGTFTYHCSIHPGMVGTVTVQ